MNSDIEGIVLDAAGSKVYGGHINYEVGRWRWQLGASQIDYQLEAPDEYWQGLRFLERFNPLLAQAYGDVVEPVTIQMTSIGAAYDRGPLQVQAMLGQLNRPGDRTDLTSAFVTLSYRLEPVTPYVTLSGSRTPGIAYRDVGLPIDGKAGLTQQTLSLGARYDVAPNVALKGQVGFVNVDQVGLAWRQVKLDWDRDTTVLSLALDFVF